MADGRRHVTIEAGGEVYNLRVSYNALCDVIDKLGPVDLHKIAMPVARVIVWAGVNNYGLKTITISQAGDICEAIIREKGLAGYQAFLKSLIDESDWLNGDEKKGADTGNPDAPIPATSES
jgi:hypothetical protein